MEYIVYQHRRCDNNEIFYVGISNNEDRPFVIHNRNNFWKNIYKKVGRTVEIVTTCDTLLEACQVEQYLIKFYGRRDLGLGPLVNLTDGGESGAGSYSELTETIRRLKMSVTHHKKRNSKVKKYYHKEQKLKKLLRIQRELPKIISTYEKVSKKWVNIEVIDISTNIVYENIYSVPVELHYLQQKSLRKVLAGTDPNKTNLRLWW